MTVALTGFGVYRPPSRRTAAEIAAESGIPEQVVVEKMGIREKRVCPPDEDHVSEMCVTAGERALADAGIEPDELDLVLYHGSEYKDYYVWSVACEVAHRLGAEGAYATENHTLCASTPTSLRQTRSQLATGDVDAALLVTASRESDIVDLSDEDASFMFNFGAGAGAAVLERHPGDDRARAIVRESAAVSDGSFARDVVMPAGGSRNPPSHETVERGLHTVTVEDPDAMKERMAPVSGPNFLQVADDALAASGYDRDDVDYLTVTHMKRSFHAWLLDELGLEPGKAYYLDEYGHVQSVDQWLGLAEGLDEAAVEPGDVVLFLAAGTGYTWAATVLDWRG